MLFQDLIEQRPEHERMAYTHSLDAAEAAAVAEHSGSSNAPQQPNETTQEYIGRLREGCDIPLAGLTEPFRFFAEHGNDVGAYLARGVPLDLRDEGRARASTEALLFTLAAQLGFPYGYSGQRDNEIIQDLIPKPEDKDKQLGTGSTTLDWHTEAAHATYSGDLIGLLCMRGDPGAITYLSRIHPEKLDDEVLAQLERVDYTIGPDASHGGASRLSTPLISYRDGQMVLRFDPLYTSAQNMEAQAALDILAEEVDRRAIGFVLEQGDLLLIDNNTSAHARSEYSPRYDGTDRWLRRIIVSKTVLPPEYVEEGNPLLIKG